MRKHKRKTAKAMTAWIFGNSDNAVFIRARWYAKRNPRDYSAAPLFQGELGRIDGFRFIIC